MDNDVYTQGTRDSRVQKENHSLLVYEFRKCEDENRLPDDPPCKPMKQINDWLRTKAVHLRILNDKIDFSKFDHGAVRQNEIWMPLLKFKPGVFSDAGYRFRENTFIKADHYIPMVGNSIQKFYDVTFFSSDEMEVTDEYPVIAEMYFRIKADTIIHSRSVFSIKEWLGSVGGVEQSLLDMLIVVFGGYCQFNSIIETFSALSKPLDISGYNNSFHIDRLRVSDTSQWERVQLYLFSELPFPKCCKKKGIDDLIKRVGKAVDQVHNDFNLKNMIIDYKMVQQDKVMEKFRQSIERSFVVHNKHAHKHNVLNMLSNKIDSTPKPDYKTPMGKALKQKY